jgi:hypothetical protein
MIALQMPHRTPLHTSTPPCRVAPGAGASPYGEARP